MVSGLNQSSLASEEHILFTAEHQNKTAAGVRVNRYINCRLTPELLLLLFIFNVNGINYQCGPDVNQTEPENMC